MAKQTMGQELDRIRERSISKARRLGYPVNLNLPRLDSSIELRNEGEITTRMLCLNVVIACTCGFPRARGQDRLRSDGIYDKLTPGELLFLESGSGAIGELRQEVEGLWALAWAGSLVRQLDFYRYCGSNLVTVLPDLDANESNERFLSSFSLRKLSDVASACDLAYCLHWAVRQAVLDGTPPPGKAEPYVVLERRRALEWLIGDDPWDEVPLDT